MASNRASTSSVKLLRSTSIATGRRCFASSSRQYIGAAPGDASSSASADNASLPPADTTPQPEAISSLIHNEMTPSALSTLESDRAARQAWRSTLDSLSMLGSTQTPDSTWKPAHTRLNPPSPREVTISHLLAATTQVGHSTAKLTRAYQPWVYGTRHGIAQIDVEKATLPALRRASKVVKETILQDGVVLILGTQKETQRAVVAAARRMGQNGFHVTRERWLPGVLTNAPKMLGRAIMESMQDYQDFLEANSSAAGEAAGGKDRGRRSKNRNNDDNDASAIADEMEASKAVPMPSLAKLASQLLQPDLLIVLNPKSNLHAIKEASLLNIPTIALVDTDVDPRIVTYPIPGNDESTRVQELIVGVLSMAGQEGRTERQKRKEEQERRDRRKERGQRRG